MVRFTSDRERRLWLWTLAALVAIYSTLGPARSLAAALRERNLLGVSFAIVVVLLVAVILIQWVKTRPGWAEIGVALGVVLTYLAVLARIETPEERTHLIEYGIVAALIHQALLERVRNGSPVPAPAALTVAATALLGVLDETIQAMLPNRVFDIRDIGFNAFAGFMFVAARLALAPQRGPGWRLWFLWLIANAWAWGMAVVVTGLGELSLQSSPLRIMAAYQGVAAAGILAGALQWLLLRKRIAREGWWLLTNPGAAAVLGVVVFGVGAIDPDMGWVWGTGIVGTVAGLLQWLVLRGQVPRAGWWVLASTVGWVLGIPAGQAVGWNGLGAVYGVVTGTVLVLLLRQKDVATNQPSAVGTEPS